MGTFILRRIDPDFWSRVQAKAARDGVNIKPPILKLLAQWLGVVLLALSTVACEYHAPDAPTPIAPISSAAPATLNLGSVAGSGSSVGATALTATVQNSGGVALPGVLVSFATDVGTLSAASMMTTASGQAVATLTSAAGSTSAVTVTAGTLSTHLLVTTPAAVVAPTTPPPPVPLPDPTTPPGPFTVTLLATTRQAGTPTDFSLATTSIRTATWTFGDSSASVTTSDPFVSHIYAAGGTYTAGVTVTDTLGRVASATATVAIALAPPPTPPPPTGLVVTLTCTIAVHGSATVCNVSATNNGAPLASNTIELVDWDWGDGVGQRNTATPLGSHAYVQAGSYRIEANTSVRVDGELRQMRVARAVVIL